MRLWQMVAFHISVLTQPTAENADCCIKCESAFKGKYYCKSGLSLFCLDSAALCMLNECQCNLPGQIQTSQTGGQPYSDTTK